MQVLQNLGTPTRFDFCRDEVRCRRIRNGKAGLFTHSFNYGHNPSALAITSRGSSRTARPLLEDIFGWAPIYSEVRLAASPGRRSARCLELDQEAVNTVSG